MGTHSRAPASVTRLDLLGHAIAETMPTDIPAVKAEPYDVASTAGQVAGVTSLNQLLLAGVLHGASTTANSGPLAHLMSDSMAASPSSLAHANATTSTPTPTPVIAVASKPVSSIHTKSWGKQDMHQGAVFPNSTVTRATRAHFVRDAYDKALALGQYDPFDGSLSAVAALCRRWAHWTGTPYGKAVGSNIVHDIGHPVVKMMASCGPNRNMISSWVAQVQQLLPPADFDV